LTVTSVISFYARFQKAIHNPSIMGFRPNFPSREIRYCLLCTFVLGSLGQYRLGKFVTPHPISFPSPNLREEFGSQFSIVIKFKEISKILFSHFYSYAQFRH
jgi:hypothetical protein